MNDNYPNAAEMVRNLADLKTPFEILEEEGRFRIVRLAPPFFDGYEFWVVNERGFLWEPAESIELARAYLESDDARES